MCRIKTMKTISRPAAGCMSAFRAAAFAVIAGLMLLTSAPVPAQLATGPSQTITGEWNWGAGGSGNRVVIYGNGSGRDSAGHTMQWALVDPVARRYRLHWSHGFVDEAELSVDGTTLNLVNNVGTRFTSTRLAGAGAATGPVAGGPSISPWTTLRPAGNRSVLRVLNGIGFTPGNYTVFVGDTDASGRGIVSYVSDGPWELRAGETWHASIGGALRFAREQTPSAAGSQRASVEADNTDVERWKAICILPAGMAVTACNAGSGNVLPVPGSTGTATPPVFPTPPDGGVGDGGPLPGGEDVYDSTSIRRGDPFNGGEWANSQNGHAFARRAMMPPVCIGGVTIESAGSDMSTRGARISIVLIGSYGARHTALDLRNVAVNRDFSPGGSGDVVPPQTVEFPPFRTSRIEVDMRGHGWFLMKGLRFRVVACP